MRLYWSLAQGKYAHIALLLIFIATSPFAWGALVCESSETAWPMPPPDAVNVQSFGAIPDDDTDDTQAIQRAIKSMRPGSFLVFPPGRYEYNRSIQLTVSNVVLLGKGATLHGTNPDDQALIVRADHVRVFGFTLTAETDYRRTRPESARLVAFGPDTKTGFVDGTVFKGNLIQPGAGGNSSSSAGILMISARNFTVAENVVERTLADGIHVSGRSSNGQIIGNQVRETGDDMIAVVSYLDKSHPEQTDPASRVSNVLIAENQVDGQYWGRGIAVVGGDAISIINNVIKNTTHASGILLAHEDVYMTFGPTNILVSGNQIEHVQTSKPRFIPIGPSFEKLNAGHAAHMTIMTAGIEIHSIASVESSKNDNLLPLIVAKNIQIKDNQISDTRKDGIRVGVDTPADLLENINIVNNKLTKIGGEPIAFIAKGAPIRGLSCTKNISNHERASSDICFNPKNTENNLASTGATLKCERF